MKRRQRAACLVSGLLRSAPMLVWLAAALQPAPALARLTSLSNLFVFGDSLSDSGNARELTHGAFPPTPPYQNRFSDGKVAVEYLWDHFNPSDTSFSPSLKGGTNYAIGGATTGQENNLEYGASPGPSLSPLFVNRGNAWQLSSFGSTPFDPKTALFAIWLFPNDIFYYNASGNSAGTASGSDGTPITFFEIPDLAVSNIASSIQTLASRGAVNFLVVNSPNLNQVPAFLNSSNMAKISQAFNTKLENKLAMLESDNPQLDITLFRLDQALNAIVADPLAYGFTNVTTPCFTLVSICASPSTYLYWDMFHPTTAAHSLLGERMAKAVPGPLPVLGGLMAFRRSRQLRRRRRSSLACGQNPGAAPA